MSVSVNDMHRLSEEVAHAFAEQQQKIMQDLERLRLLIYKLPLPSEKSLIDEQRDADRFHSNSHESQKRREQVFKAQIMRSIQEKKDLHKIIVYFLQKQREFLTQQNVRDNQRTEKEKKQQEVYSFALDEEHKKKLIKLNEDLLRLLEEMQRKIDLLSKIIQELQSVIVEANRQFNQNFEKTIRRGLEQLGQYEDGKLFLLIDERKISVNIDNLVSVLSKVNTKAFERISRGESVDIQQVREEARAEVKTFFMKNIDKNEVGEAQFLSTVAERVADRVMQVWEKQSDGLDHHLICQQVVQRGVDDLSQARDCNIKASELMKKGDEAVLDEDFLDVGIDKKNESLTGIRCVLSSIDTNKMARVAHMVTALENRIISEQSKLNQPEANPSLEEESALKNGRANSP